ncbi:Cuticlin-1 [Aphelenchoides fujianensis]|nr:Cuticlin-1 [Aphelenchoides fujianensis]
MPCQYTIEPTERRAADECGSAQNFFLGEPVIHRWNCKHFDAYQSILIRNCEYVDLRTNVGHRLIDENGCSLQSDLMETPEYTSSTSAHARGVIFRPAGQPAGQNPLRAAVLRSSDDRMRQDFARRNATRSPSDKQDLRSGIRPLNWDQSPPLVTFGKMEKQSGDPRAQLRGSSVDVKLSTQDVKVVETPAEAQTKAIPPSTTSIPSAKPKEDAPSKPSPCTSIECIAEANTESAAADPTRSTNDPFQDEWRQISSGIEDPMDLDEFVMQKLSVEEIQIESPTMNVQNQRNLTCRFRT